MARHEKRLTNMIWRSMAESIGLSLVLFGVIMYFLHSGGYMKPFHSFKEGVAVSLTIIAAMVVIGGAFGLWSSYRVKSRIATLRDVMISLEKGNLSRSVPPLGEDEIGRLGEQLNAITTKWEEQVTSLQRLSSNNAQLAQKAKYSAIIEERQRLARELHDAVSQQLFAISMTATAVGRTLEKDFDKARRQIYLIEEMASVAQSEMRALLLHLRPVHLEGKRLSEGLIELVRELSSKVPMQITWDLADIRLPRGIEDHLFRIVQEAMSNALRHSRATEMEVRLTQPTQDAIKLIIRDNGVGFELDTKKQASYGIMTMRERVNEIGGSIHLVTAPGKGTRIEIRVPIMAEEESEDVGGSD